MAKKPSITTVTTGYQATDTINDNFQNIRNAFDNVLSRDGSTPNFMDADLDMDSNDILNVNTLSVGGLYINGQPVSPGTIQYNGVTKETQVATSGQTVFNLTTITYTPGINNLSVYVDGVYQNPSTYSETNATRVTFSVGLHVGAIVDFVALTINSLSGTTDAINVTYTPQGVGAVNTTVSAKLKETVSVKDFGAVGDGTTDDTVAIQAAINSGAKKIIGVAGEIYKITDSLTVYFSNIELDFQNAALLLNDVTGLKSHILVGDGITQTNGVRINSIIFTRSQVATAGYAIYGNFVGVLNIVGCRVFGDNKIYNGIGIYKGIIINLENNYIQNCVNDGIYLEGAGLVGIDRTVDVSLYQNRVEGGLVGFNTWDFVEGVYCRNNIFYNQTTVCVSLNASSSVNAMFSFKLQQNDFDTSTGGALYVDKVDAVQISDNWFSNFASFGIEVKDTALNVQIEDNLIFPQNTGYGIALYSSDTLVSGNKIAGGTNCIQVKPTALRNAILNNQLSGPTLIVVDNSATRTSIIGNDLTAASVNAITGTGINSYFSGNSQVSNPISSVSVGASPYTYTAGPYRETLYILGGTVTSVVIDGNSLFTATNCQVALNPNQSVVITYSSAPNLTRSTHP